jgi:hypothetical protein
VALALSLLTACGVSPHHTLNGSSAAQQLKSELEATYPGASVTVTCPGKITARAGATFTCDATLDGQPVRYDAKGTNSNGGISATPQSAVTSVAELINQLQKNIASTKDLPADKVTVTCGSLHVAVARAGATFQCTASLPGQKPSPVTITYRDSSGKNVLYKLVVNPGGSAAGPTPP